MAAKTPEQLLGSPAIAAIERPSTLTARAYESIRAGIRDGLFEPGRLYSEAALAESLGISRTPVREAMIELTREGLIEIRNRSGFRLRRLSASDRQEVFALRMAVESVAVERLASHAGPVEIEALSVCLDCQRDLHSDPGAFLAADEAMHLLIPELSGLARTRNILLTIRSSVWLMANLALTRSERFAQVVAEHEAIVAAVAAADPEAAVRAMQAHLSSTLIASDRVPSSQAATHAPIH